MVVVGWGLRGATGKTRNSATVQAKGPHPASSDLPNPYNMQEKVRELIR